MFQVARYKKIRCASAIHHFSDLCVNWCLWAGARTCFCTVQHKLSPFFSSRLFLHCKSTLLSICLGFEQKKRTKLSAGNSVGMGGSAMSAWKKRRNAMILWCPEACNFTTSGTLPVSFLRRYSSTRPASAGSSAHRSPVTARPPLSGWLRSSNPYLLRAWSVY